MKNVVLYIAMSIDGYIADRQGSVDWIKGQDDKAETPDTWTPFFENIDTVIMGRKTYQQIVTELSPGAWVYDGAVTYVLTHDATMPDTETVRFRDTDPCLLVEQLRKGTGKDIWICGGAETVAGLIDRDMIDVYHIAIIPVLLGSGIKQFGKTDSRLHLTLRRTLSYNGIVELVYERKHQK
ncbi:dihydrofolate reductase [Palleniella muris]|uniref:Dihydrofolate reductase n=1 Tax=Palleniella muris TaxID=3038145 RepID=A0AC61QRQ6_9BACT|nr:dihydrofolate reductase family protein [Palleniella muris]TGX82867.1 dihydrofolate reductase [Palleniella muris]